LFFLIEFKDEINLIYLLKTNELYRNRICKQLIVQSVVYQTDANYIFLSNTTFIIG